MFGPLAGRVLRVALAATDGSDRGASSVVGVVLMVGVTVIAASAIAVVVFGIDVNHVANSLAEILNMDQTMPSTSP